jgi:hypothetical protein
MRIITVSRDDIAPRDSRWQAWEGDLDLDIAIGSGPTPEAAVEDLLWHLDVEQLPPDAIVQVRQ